MNTDSVAPARILVVDDNELNRDMLSRRLVRQGHEVEQAVDGRAALDVLAGSEFDLLLLDIMMPVMNGYEVLDHLRADETLRHLPVILISALDDTDSVIRGIDKGADDHLPKPFDPQILAARVGACLAKKRLRDSELRYARALQREIDIARDIQAGFLPGTLPAAPGCEIAARFIPARQVAGDFYDAFELPGGRLCLVVADVCGKGVGAALFMALFRSLLRALAEQNLMGVDLHAEVRHVIVGVNDYIARTHGSAHMFATIFLGVLDPATGELVYANGGHDAAAINHDGQVRARLEPTGPAVGMMPGLDFTTAAATLRPGETLLIFTDGVSDARDDAGAHFTEERLVSLALEPHPTAAALLDRIESEVAAHRGSAEAFDDITLLAVMRA